MTSPAGYSSTVNLTLRVDGRYIALAKIGPEYIVLGEQAEVRQGEATIIMDIDGDVKTWPVSIRHDSVPFDDVIAVKDLPPAV